MEKGKRPRAASGQALVRALVVVLALVAVAVASGTVYGLASGTRQKKLQREAELANAPAGSYVFTRIGTVRASTPDTPPAVVVATISFPYPAGDRPFAEELDTKAEALRAASVAWLSRQRAADLLPAYEGSVKAGLRDTLNSLLSLGKVEEVWLSDFAVVQ